MTVSCRRTKSGSLKQDAGIFFKLHHPCYCSRLGDILEPRASQIQQLLLRLRYSGQFRPRNLLFPTSALFQTSPFAPRLTFPSFRQVLTFYCTRRAEAYEPVLCALVGPLFSMGLDPPAVSAVLNPLVGSLTLFLGRGMTHVVRDLAWAHAHRRLHDLCTYHDPELVQHLNR